MSITETVRFQARQRANFSCEFCGVTEMDAGGELTLDHFHPQSRGGADELDNLLYCCQRCNQYKADYWPTHPDDPVLWNPRQESCNTHLLTLTDGTLYPLTPTGAFTLGRLRLNRPPLVAHRLRKSYRDEEQRLLTRYRDLVAVLEQLQKQHTALLEEQRALLEEQRALLTLVVKQKK